MASELNIEGFDSLVLFTVGRTPVTVGGLVFGVLLIVGGFLGAKLAGAALRRLRGRTGDGASALYIVEKLVTYGLMVFGVVAGLSTVGLNFSSLAVFAGAVGVGIGLGLQGVVKEFVSGLVLVFDRILNVGDYVELGDGKRGLVQEIGPRAVRIRTNDNVEIWVPNSHFIEGPVVNWTLRGRTRRIHVPFVVAYGSDRNLVRKVVLEAAHASPLTRPDTPTERSQVWLIEFARSGLKFELVVWPTPEAVKRPAALHAAYTWLIADALEAAGVEAPLEQLQLRFGEEAEAVEGMLRPRPPRARRAAGHNDAADDVAMPDEEPSAGPFPDQVDQPDPGKKGRS